MSVKPSVDEREAQQFLGQFFDEPVREVAPLGTGHMARVYSFWAGKKEWVVRFVNGTMVDTLRKETAVAKLLSGTAVPLPLILHHGDYRYSDLSNGYFAIAPRVAGRPLDELSPEEYAQALPDVIMMLDTIHQVDVSGTTGYGFFDETGDAPLSNWRDYLLSVAEENEGDFYGQWHHLFEESFLERPLFDQLYSEMQRLFVYLPEERYLVHGDYGFNNVLAEGEQVTAVLDWANAKYGDFLIDVASLSASSKIDYVTQFKLYYEAHGRIVPNYLERIRCYQCRGSLDGMRFFAKTDNCDGYEWIKDLIARDLGFE